MDNHFGKGLMAGLNAHSASGGADVARFCADYRRGFVLGYTHRMGERTGNRQQAAWEAGVLTRRYQLDKNLVEDFFTEVNNDMALRFFLAGYEKGQ